MWSLLSNNVVLPDSVGRAAILIEGTQIVAVGDPSAVPADVDVVDVGDRFVLPGIVDIHVHINEPGRTEWEGFASATSAAVAGGVTTLVDMPLNSQPVTTTAAALKLKRRAAEGIARANLYFYGGLVPGSAGEIPALCDAGVLGVKAFLCDSGLPDFPAARLEDLWAAMPVLARRGSRLLVHCELVPPDARQESTRCYKTYARSRPPEWEVAAIGWMIELCRRFECPVHIVHVATRDAIERIAAAKDEGLPLTAETCPHYLTFACDEIPDGQTQFKCAPPIRTSADREGLWQALVDGTIDCIASDHSPCPPEMKCLDSGDFGSAWGGIAGLQFSLPIVASGAAQRDIDIERVSRWLSARPAEVVGLGNRKGRVEAGYDADLVVWEPGHAETIARDTVRHRHKLTPYEGRRVQGRVSSTYVLGERRFHAGRGTEDHVGDP